MNMTRRDVLRATAVLGGAAALSAGLVRPAAAQTTQKKELVVAQGGDVAFFDPHMSTSPNDTRVSFNVFDNLVARHPDGTLGPALATEWKLDGKTTWRFKLRTDVTWHDGDPFTSADARFSIERTYDSRARLRVSRAFTSIDRIQTPDAATLVIHTRKPDPLLPARLASHGGQIVPRKYLEAVGPDTFNRKPVGTGPLRLVSWTKDDRAVFAANPDYWGGQLDFDRMILRAVPETAQRVTALLKGEVDVITPLPPEQAEMVKAAAATRVVGALPTGLVVLAVNSKRPPLDDPLVKQAMSLAVDRELIVKEIWRGRGIVPSGPIAKGDHHFDGSLPPLAYDPRDARARLRKAGYKNEEIVLETTAGSAANDETMSEAVVAMWRDIGLNARVEVIDASARARKGEQKSYQGLWWSSPTSTLGDPDDMMWRLLAPGGPHDYWRHAKFDELGEAARLSVDEQFRSQAYREMTKIFLEHLPWIPVVQRYEDYGLQKYVEWTPSPSQRFEVRRFGFKFKRA